MKKILIALAGVAALGATPMTFAQSSGANDLARTQEIINHLQADQRAVMLDTLALKPDQLAKFTPIYDEYQAERKKLYTDATQLLNRLWVADYGGMTDDESKAIQKAAFKLRHDRLACSRSTLASSTTSCLPRRCSSSCRSRTRSRRCST